MCLTSCAPSYAHRPSWLHLLRLDQSMRLTGQCLSALISRSCHSGRGQPVELREYDGAPVRPAERPALERCVGSARLNLSTGPSLQSRPDPDRDVDVSTVLRVVSAFEELEEGSASLADLASTVASWTGFAAGLSGPGGLVLAHRDQAGRRVGGGEPALITWREVLSDDALIARIWIERGPAERPLDALVLDRGARAAQQIIERLSQESLETSRDHASCVALLVDAAAPTDQRARACAQMGLGLNQPIRIAVSRVSPEGTTEWTRGSHMIQSRGAGQSRVELHGNEAIAVICASGQAEAEGLPTAGEQARWGVGPVHPALEAPRSYRWARETLRFVRGPGTDPVARFDELGCVVALTGAAQADLIDLPDLVALTDLSQTETGLTAILTAEVLMRTGSQRDAAAAHESASQHRRPSGRPCGTRTGLRVGRACELVPSAAGHSLVATDWSDPDQETVRQMADGGGQKNFRYPPDDSGVRPQLLSIGG